MKELKAAIALIAFTFALTTLAVLIASPAGQIGLQVNSIFIDAPVIPFLVSAELIALALFAQPRRTLYKVPIKLAAILLCLYGSSLIIPQFSGGVMAMAPYCLVTLVLLLVVFW
jgi:hypothetical protein